MKRRTEKQIGHAAPANSANLTNPANLANPVNRANSANSTKRRLVSVIMPVHNEAKYLHESIDSILNQTYPHFEFIIIDDGSTDKTPQILKQYARKDRRIKIITTEKIGLAEALNIGLQKASGYFIARMDADDISAFNRFEEQIAYLQSHKNLIAVGAQAELIDQQGDSLGMKSFPTNSQKLHDLMFVTMPIQHPLLMTYAHIMKQCSYENKSTAEDVSMFFQLLTFGDFGNVPKNLLRYRIRPESNSLKDPKKTFHLTLMSRIKGVRVYGYRPKPQHVLMNLAQAFAVYILPNPVILWLYSRWRFNTARPATAKLVALSTA